MAFKSLTFAVVALEELGGVALERLVQVAAEPNLQQSIFNLLVKVVKIFLGVHLLVYTKWCSLAVKLLAEETGRVRDSPLYHLSEENLQLHQKLVLKLVRNDNVPQQVHTEK